jgi:hypothetical protein
MNKPRENKKAPSPVTKTIVQALVAVALAVVIAVAAWLGALTKTDQFNVAYVGFSGASGASMNYINMTIQNTGSSSWTLASTAQVNSIPDLYVTSIGNGAKLNCSNSRQIEISITMIPGWASGNQYSVTLMMTDGNKITCVTTAP